MMHGADFGFGWGFGFFNILWMLLFWGGLLALGIWLIRQIFPTGQSKTGEDSSPREILQKRYAKGELTTEQYRERLEALES